MPSTHSVYQRALFLAARSAVAAILIAQAADAGPTQFWDLNGAGAGAGGGGSPSGTWDLITPNWSTDPSGSSPTAPWINNSPAVFSAGTDANGAYTVAVAPTANLLVAGLRFEEGSVDVVAGAGATLALTAPNVDVATAIFANISQGISGNAGLLKLGNGMLQLGGSNSFTGPTTVRNGSLVLDYSQALAPASNMIPPTSPLIFNDPTAAQGNADAATLSMVGKVLGASAQTFSSTLIAPGSAVLRVDSGAGGSATLNLGALTHNAGGYAAFIQSSGVVTTTTSNTNGILGGWAVTGNGSTGMGVLLIDDWATVDGNGVIGAYSAYTDVPGGLLHSAPVTAASNVRGVFAVDADNANTTTDVNTIKATGNISIGQGNTLRLGKFGGILRASFTPSNFTIGSTQDSGTLTAGGVLNQSGEINFIINNTSQKNGSALVECRVADNGAGAVTVIKSGPGAMKFRGHNTYSGGTYILQGRFQLVGTEIGTSNPDGFGTGPVYIRPGGQAYLSGVGNVGPTNDFYISGLGTNEEAFGAIRLGTFTIINKLAGRVILTGDARLVGDSGAQSGATFTGQITGGFNLQFGTDATSFGVFSGSSLNITNPTNDWSGDTQLVSSTQLFSRLILGNNEVIPDGPGKGNVVFTNPIGPRGSALLDLAGFSETINGLSTQAGGSGPGGSVQNRVGGTTSTLTVGANNQSASFAGTIDNAPGTLALVKIGTGVQSLSGQNSYTGATRIDNGTLAITGNGSIAKTSITIATPGVLDITGVTGGANFDGSRFALTSGQRISGTGTVKGALGIGAGASVAPGNSIGTLNTNDVIFSAASSALNAEIDLRSPRDADLLNVTGLVSLSGSTLNLLVTSAGSPAFPLTYILVQNDGADPVNGSFGSINVPAGLTATAVYNFSGVDSVGRIGTGNDIAVVLTPEPGTLAFLPLLAMLIRRRRAFHM